MAENCQYCGGRLKRLHPAHETFCSQRPQETYYSKPEPVLIKTVEDVPAALAAVSTKAPVSSDPVSKPKTDRKAYMRELMRKKRAAKKGDPDGQG